MTKWICKSKVLLLFFLLGSEILSASPLIKKQLTKEIHKSFDVNSDALLGVQNRHGNINISTWDRNIIEVDVVMTVKTGNESKGQTYLDGINIEFSSSSSKVGMKTVYPDQYGGSSWWSSWWNNSNNIDFEVHYTIRAPQGISTSLINKYGSISQTSIGGSSNVTNKYGDIFIDNVGGNLILDLGYGKAQIVETNSVVVDIKYGTMSIGSCSDIRMNSKYSNFKFGRCGDINLDSKYDEFVIESAGEIVNNGKYDDFKIGEVESLVMDTKNTTVRVEKLSRKCKIDTKYGSIHVSSTGPDLEQISLESKYTEYKFGIDSDFHLKFLGDKTDLSIDVPHETYQNDRDGSEIITKAYRGSKSAKLKISADLNYGALKITENR